MKALRLAFLVAALLIVAADAVLLRFGLEFHERLQTRLFEEYERGAWDTEEARSWREYDPYHVPADAVAAQFVLVRSPLADPEPGVVSRFFVKPDSETKSGWRLGSPWFADGWSTLDPGDPQSAEKRRRFERFSGRFGPTILMALRDAELWQTERSRGLTTDVASREVVTCQAEPAKAAAEIAEAKRGNVAAQQKLSVDWANAENVQTANPFYGKGQNRARKEPVQQVGQAAAAPQQQMQAEAVPAPPPPPQGYEVRVTHFRRFAWPDALYMRRVDFISDSLPPIGPYYQGFELDTGLAASSFTSDRGLLYGAAGLLFLLGTGGLALLYGGVASRLEVARRRAEFNAAVSHELKAPLAGIRALAEMLHEGIVSSPEKTREYVANILHESERLSRLIANVLDTARLERRERTYAVQAADPSPAIREAVEIFRTHLLGRGFELAIELPETLPAALHDRDALVQSLANLIDNAAKYTAPCPTRRIAIRARALPSGVAIEVEDSGIGVAPEDRARIFEPYRRGRDPLALGTGGAGLGLPIAKSHVEAMGGRLELASAGPSRGSTFRILLPVPAPPSPDPSLVRAGP